MTVAKGKITISHFPLAEVLQVPQVAKYTQPSMGGEAAKQLNTPASGARFTINGVTIPADAGVHTAQNFADAINNAACGATATIDFDGSLYLQSVPSGGPLTFGGDSTLRTSLGLL